MSRIYFEDLPSTNTPRNAANLNKLNNVVISSTEPNTGEEVWVQKGKNLFNINTDVEFINGIRQYENGQYASVNNYNGLKFRVKPNTQYATSTNSTSWSNICFFDKNMNFISGLTYSNQSTFTTPNNCYYVTLAIKNDYTWFQLEIGSTPTSYEPYINKTIYTKNDNGVYELFYDETSSNIESGSNNNGSYVKYPDGTMICYATFNQNFNKASALWGGLYEYNLASSVSFAETFVEGPVVTAVVSAGSGGGAAFIETIAFTKTQITNLVLARPTQYTSGSTGKFYISYTAIGKWK